MENDFLIISVYHEGARSSNGSDAVAVCHLELAHSHAPPYCTPNYDTTRSEQENAVMRVHTLTTPSPADPIFAFTASASMVRRSRPALVSMMNRGGSGDVGLSQSV